MSNIHNIWWGFVTYICHSSFIVSTNLNSIASFGGTVTTGAEELKRMRKNKLESVRNRIRLTLNWTLLLFVSTFNTTQFSSAYEPSNHFALFGMKKLTSKQAKKQQRHEPRKRREREEKKDRADCWSEIMLTSAVRMFIFAIQYRLIVRSTRTTATHLLCIFLRIFITVSNIRSNSSSNWSVNLVCGLFVLQLLNWFRTLLIDSVKLFLNWNSLSQILFLHTYTTN